MIDLVEIIIAFVSTDVVLASLVGDRIANKHRYGDPALGMWAQGQTSLTVHQETGIGEVYRPVLTATLELRCYASTQAEAMAIWLRLADLARESQRVIVQTSNGQALLYYLVPLTAATQLFDEEVGMDVAMGMFEAMVYREVLV